MKHTDHEKLLFLRKLNDFMKKLDDYLSSDRAALDWQRNGVLLGEIIEDYADRVRSEKEHHEHSEGVA